jgi:hypothetical protein
MMNCAPSAEQSILPSNSTSRRPLPFNLRGMNANRLFSPACREERLTSAERGEEINAVFTRIAQLDSTQENVQASLRV